MTASATILAENGRTSRPTRRRELRPGWGTGRRTRPQARPARPVSAPTLVFKPAAAGQACRVVAPAGSVRRPAVAVAAGGWRLSDRGIALVLATGLALVTMALVVIGLTAGRVTSDTYFSGSQLTTLQR